MGKIDDMRRQREQQFADAEHREAKAAKARPVVADPPGAAPVSPASAKPESEPSQPTRPARPTSPTKTTSAKTGETTSEQGKCPECGKMKPLQGGVMASHQKGFGKACPGSRKKPA